MIAAFCDVMDGLVARWLHCSSDFGKQLDSLADIVSFGVAPAFLILLFKLSDIGWMGVVTAVLFIACGALRLARFNLLAPSTGFVGMPITAAGLLLAMSSLLSESLNPWILVSIIGALSFLMVSRIPFPSLKRNIGHK
jgi:CDP-diacylglycerol--serine O-phosphatidyltransferase